MIPDPMTIAIFDETYYDALMAVVKNNIPAKEEPQIQERVLH